MSKPLVIFLVIVFNMAPVAGVLFYHWEPFEAFWFFWLETLIMAVFNSIKIFLSQHRAAGELQPGTAMNYHAGKAITYLLIRIGIFFFYAIFIITFIGFVANKNSNTTAVLQTLLFQNRFFNLGLLVSMVSQGYYLLFYFLRNGAYLQADPDSFAAIFDGRQIIMHVAIVLGTFCSVFLVKYTSFGHYGTVAMISVFCICKCAAELFNARPGGAITAV